MTHFSLRLRIKLRKKSTTVNFKGRGSEIGYWPAFRAETRARSTNTRIECVANGSENLSTLVLWVETKEFNGNTARHSLKLIESHYEWCWKQSNSTIVSGSAWISNDNKELRHVQGYDAITKTVCQTAVAVVVKFKITSSVSYRLSLKSFYKNFP